ncbi:S1 RNA-binding domain-containing protein [Dictyobacter kobayashii]|uniref:S1 motif domain-containing protein n=1 Tax=Dictyobacter kobayashii TaxID=2014872 RepID=A0A402AYU2_9CHLR|nr:S1 RNA-binding domain-containing protein [Dictyobacter kobayashii]GCE24248.1 hypothetical protein KDK_80480 [Dictyobacter kobayashii]
MSEEHADVNPLPEDTWSLLEEHYKNGRPLVGRIVEWLGSQLIVDINGIQGTIENAVLGFTWRVAELTVDEQHLSEEELVQQQLEALKGQQILVTVQAVDRQLHILTLSQQIVTTHPDTPERRRQRQQLLSRLRPGDICKGRITTIHGRHASVDLGGVEGFILPHHISGQQRFIDPWKVVQPGQEVSVMIMEKNKDTLLLSLTYARRRDEVLSKLAPGDTCPGTISALADEGVYVDLGGVLALIPVDQVVSGYITHPADLYHRSQKVVVKLQEITAEKRVTASLVQAD